MYVCIEKTIEESNLVMDVRYGKRCLVFWFNYVCVFYPVEIEAIQEALVPRSDSWTQHWKLIAVFAARLLAWRIPRIIINPDNINFQIYSSVVNFLVVEEPSTR